MSSPGLALLVANVRYWSTVAPAMRTQLTRWERRAGEIPDPLLQALASSKLREERFNVEVAATLATLAPRAHRRSAVEAIVALQVMYDYLDLLTEQPSPDPLPDGRRLYGALRDALTPGGAPEGDYYRHHPRCGDGGYLQELVGAVRLALADLPTTAAVTEVALRGAERCAQAQVLIHAAARAEARVQGFQAHTAGSRPGDPAVAELERWARREAEGTALQWPEYLAGAAASVIGVHALIAAAADRRTTPADAEALDAVYLSIGALTMLDSLVDHREDTETGERGFLCYYESAEQMAGRLVSVAADAKARARSLPDAAHHVMTLVGVVAYYTSAPSARSAPTLPVAERMRRELWPLIAPTLALMRAWRLAKRARAAFDSRRAAASWGGAKWLRAT
jgi:tetraprenyl-beta-curcumene synthase